jgi:hypothetical protein
LLTNRPDLRTLTIGISIGVWGTTGMFGGTTDITKIVLYLSEDEMSNVKGRVLGGKTWASISAIS